MVLGFLSSGFSSSVWLYLLVNRLSSDVWVKRKLASRESQVQIVLPPNGSFPLGGRQLIWHGASFLSVAHQPFSLICPELENLWVKMSLARSVNYVAFADFSVFTWTVSLERSICTVSFTQAAFVSVLSTAQLNSYQGKRFVDRWLL